MKTKQKSIRVFEIECENLFEFEAYLDKNAVLLNGFLLMLKGDADGLFGRECKKRGLCYASMGECEEGTLLVKKDLPPLPVEEKPSVIEEAKPKKVIIKPQAALPLESIKQESEKTPKTLLITKTLRSGELISSESDITVLGRINSGAKVKTSANAAILDTVDGEVEVGGEYLMIKSIGKGSVVFRGEQIKKEMLDGKTKMITFDGKLTIKDV